MTMKKIQAFFLALTITAIPGVAIAQAGGSDQDQVDCAAYYGIMAELSLANRDRQTASQYDATAGYAFDSVMSRNQHNQRAIETLASRLNTVMEEMNAMLGPDGDPAELIRRYDDPCRRLITGQR